MKLSEMKQVLAARRLQLTKSLGQNFLHDQNQLRRIIEAANLKKTDKVLEIGPGLGPLTELLLQEAGHVLAIEKDRRLVEVLQERFQESLQANTLTLIEDDALEYLRRERRDWSGWKLVANLPYSVASPIIVELAQSNPGPNQMVATLQIEVARRLMAQPAEADYGILTLLVQLEYEPDAGTSRPRPSHAAWFKIPAACFFPEPEVDSACVSLRRRERPLLSTSSQKQTFIRLVKRGFSQRRKMLLKLLKEDWTAARLESALEKAGIPACTRAESVNLAQFAELAVALNEQG